MLGVAMGLQAVQAQDLLSGELIFFAVPAEEFIDVAERLRRRNRGEIEFLLGKPELVAKGHFDDIDLAMMIHIGSHDQMSQRSLHRRTRRTAPWSSRSASWAGPATPAARRSSASTRSRRRRSR